MNLHCRLPVITDLRNSTLDIPENTQQTFNMAMAQAANLVEKVVGHRENAITEQNLSNPARDRAKYADPSGETMKALIWMGKNTVEVGELETKLKVLATS